MKTALTAGLGLAGYFALQAFVGRTNPEAIDQFAITLDIIFVAVWVIAVVMTYSRTTSWIDRGRVTVGRIDSVTTLPTRLLFGGSNVSRARVRYAAEGEDFEWVFNPNAHTAEALRDSELVLLLVDETRPKRRCLLHGFALSADAQRSLLAGSLTLAVDGTGLPTDDVYRAA